jgi:hypothetical protein
MGLLDRLATRKPEPELRPPAVAPDRAPSVFPTKALRKFVAALTGRPQPVLLDLGPVVGSNLTFFGERLGCKIFVEDLYCELDRHVRTGTVAAFSALLEERVTERKGPVDGILCWDLMDYLDRRAAQALAAVLMRVLAADGALLACFSTTQVTDLSYTKYVIVDDANLNHRRYPATRGRQTVLPNRDILRFFTGLRVSDSFLLQNNQREILFRKPA